MKILKFKKMSNGKYKISLDNNESLVLYEDVILSQNLLIKKELEKDEIKNIIELNNEYDSYNLALKYISNKMRSKMQVKKYLLEKNISLNKVNDVINKMEKNKLLDDYNFSLAYIKDQMNLSNDGPLKIQKNLITLGIEKNIIEDTIKIINNDDVVNKLKKLIDKQLRIKKGSLNMIKLKLLNYFCNLGYEKSMIISLLENSNISTDLDLLKKEYNKLYKKYSLKKEGYELQKFIEQKLIVKGYTKEEIKKIDTN